MLSKCMLTKDIKINMLAKAIILFHNSFGDIKSSVSDCTFQE